MAEIREQLTLADRFSGTLDRYIQKMADAVSRTNNQNESLNQTSGAFDKMAAAAQTSVNAEASVNDATWALVGRLSVLQDRLRESFTPTQIDQNLNALMSSMQRMGLVWTNSEHEMYAADLLLKVGLQELADQGAITANAVARAAHQKAVAHAEERMAAQAAKQAEDEEKRAAEKAAEAQERHAQRIRALGSALLGLNRAHTPLDGIISRVVRMGLYFLSVRRMIRYMQDTLERAPAEVQGSWNGLKDTVGDTFGRVFVSALQALQPYLDRLRAALDSPAGQKLARGLEILGRTGGAALGFLLDVVSNLVEFIGNNFQTVMAIAAVVAGIFAAQMLVAAAATLLANWPLLLLIGLAAALVIGLQAAGVTAEDIFSGIGAAAGWLYALVYNLVADAWNVIAVFAEFFANVFDDPVGAVARLFFGVFDSILGIVETVAGAIDALLGTDWSGAVSGFRADMQAWVNDKFGENKIKIDRMEKISYVDTMADFAEKGASLGNALSDFSLENAIAAPLSPKLDDISSDVSSIKKSVSMTDEDIKSLVDMAERRYVNNINLTAQTPVINIKGQNTGDSAADRQALADAIRDILVEQVASGSVRTTARVF